MTTMSNTDQFHDEHMQALKNSSSAGGVKNPLAFMLLDLLGFVLIFVGLAQYFERINVLPFGLNNNMSGVFILIVGLLLTLPFLLWTLKASGAALRSLAR